MVFPTLGACALLWFSAARPAWGQDAAPSDGGLPVPECHEGRTSTLDTAGHCCWPMQAWSESRGVCVGIPACPAGMHAVAATCAADSPPQPSTPSTDGGTAPAAAVARSVPARPPAEHVHLPPWYFYLGVSLFLVAWIPALLGPTLFKDYNPDATRAGLVPFAGPLLARNSLNDYQLNRWWNVLTFVDAVVQWIGGGGVVAGSVVWILGRPP